MDYSLLFAIRRVVNPHGHGKEESHVKGTRNRTTLNESIVGGEEGQENCDSDHGDSDSEHEHDEDNDCGHDLNPPREPDDMIINEVFSSHDGHWAYQVAVIDYL